MAEANEEDVTQPTFWEQRYRDGRDGWDLGQPALAFADLLSGDEAPRPGRMIALGAGRGHDALLFAEHGYEVIAVDFAASPIAAGRAMAARRGMSDKISFEQRDMFALPQSLDGTFDYVLEHTCISAITPNRRGDYARLVHRLLKPGGLYIAIFFDHGRPGGPPFTIDELQIRAMFDGLLRVEHLAEPAVSLPQRQGQELLGLLRK